MQRLRLSSGNKTSVACRSCLLEWLQLVAQRRANDQIHSRQHCPLSCLHYNSTINTSKEPVHFLGRNTSTVIIAPDLLFQLPEHAELSICLYQMHFHTSGPNACVKLDVRTPVICDRCVLLSPPQLREFQRINASCSCLSAEGKFEFYGR